MADSTAVIGVLLRHGVDFVLVGGMAAVAHGAPVVTFDVDVVYALDEPNCQRLAAALDELGANYRGRPDIVPTVAHLRVGGRNLLMTRLGPLDVLGFAGAAHGYAYLAERSVSFEFEGANFLVADLKMLIQLKEEVGQPRDLAVIPVLRATLAVSGDADSD